MEKVTHANAIIAEDNLIADVQFALHNLLEFKGMSRRELARKLGVSEARVSNFFHHDPRNFTLKTIARIFHALGEEAQITSPGLQRVIPVKRVKIRRSQGRTPPFMAGKTDMMMARLHEEVRARDVFELEANDNAIGEELIAA